MSPKEILTDTFQGVRSSARAHCVREISVSREGHDELIRIKAPDLSSTGMFITASRSFPEGTVLNLKFRLAVSPHALRGPLLSSGHRHRRRIYRTFSGSHWGY